MFRKSAVFYDAFYSGKDYVAEAARLNALILSRGPEGAQTVLDIACGPGAHLEQLRSAYTMTGLVFDENMVDIARRRLPSVAIHLADMIDFTLGQTFDIIVCLFRAIGYTGTGGRLRAAVRCMANHLHPSGMLGIDPWFTPDQWVPGKVHTLHTLVGTPTEIHSLYRVS